MAFPPERITVKRHRDEDPVDALCKSGFILKDITLYCSLIQADIEPKRNRPSALWKRADEGDREPRFAESLPLAGPLSNNQLLTSTVHGATTSTAAIPALLDRPTGRTEVKPRLRQHVQPNHQEPAPMGLKLPASPITRPLRRSEGNKDSDESSPKPRNFRLSKNISPRTPTYAVSKHRAQMQRDIWKDDLAMFVEKREEATKSQHANRNMAAEFTESSQQDIDSGQSTIELVSPRKRPGITAEERKWRVINWSRSVEPNIYAETTTESARTIKSFKNWDTESPELAEQLQQIAVDEIISGEARTAPGNGHIRLKSQPKPPKPRQAKTKGAIDAGKIDVDMTDSNDLEDDSMYVVDTYVRSTAQPSNTEDSDVYVDPLRGLNQGNLGILVIDEDEEKLWETYGEIQESDPESNSEEEDENGL